MNKTETLMTGLSGMVATTLTPEVIAPALDLASTSQIIINIIIGIATLIGIFKKRKSPLEPN